uniref:Pepsin-I3 domain-containing protein n=1 Tax=Ascaris lumbricoides TaxID=6252 RepID=A0A0M3IQE3_ASCLU
MIGRFSGVVERLIAFTILAAFSTAERGRRCARCIDSLISQGCVITANQLYVNGYFVRILTDDEMNEFDEYSKQLEEYKNVMIFFFYYFFLA